jgi:heme A synthase
LAIGQIALGFSNVVLLAPVWLQLAHLTIADLIWIGFVLLGASSLGEEASLYRGASITRASA